MREEIYILVEEEGKRVLAIERSADSLAKTALENKEIIIIKNLKRMPISGAFTLMHTTWVINRRRWIPLCGWKTMI